MWYFQESPEFVFFWLTARGSRPSFERRRNQRCLVPLVKAIRVRVRSFDSLVCTEPGSLFCAGRCARRLDANSADETTHDQRSRQTGRVMSVQVREWRPVQQTEERLHVSDAPEEARGQCQPSSYRTFFGCEPVMKSVMIHADSSG
jgi:hypothetical protein